MNPTQDEAPSAESCFRRGQMLLARNRNVDAASWFQRALQADPSHAASHAMLALCWTHESGKMDLAVEAARRAVGLAPEEAQWHSILALTLANAGDDGKKSLISLGLGEAQKAVQLDPDDPFAHAVEARLHLLLANYPAAEESARRALALDVDNAMATEALSVALLKQHKDEDNSELIRSQLRKNPEDSATHTSAGWQALLKGRHEEANQHFLEALRLNPMSEGARQGLVESYRARSSVYRLYLRFCHAMDRLGERGQGGLLLGGFIAYQVLRTQLSKVSPALSGVLTIAWITLALWSHLARSIGTFFMLFDRFARQSLRARERWDGVLVGGFLVLGLAFLVRSFLSGWALDKEVAISLFLGAVPVAAAFANTHYWGRYYYTGLAIVTGLTALYGATSVGTRYAFPYVVESVTLACVLGAGTTWMRMLRIGYHHGA